MFAPPAPVNIINKRVLRARQPKKDTNSKPKVLGEVNQNKDLKKKKVVKKVRSTTVESNVNTTLEQNKVTVEAKKVDIVVEHPVKKTRVNQHDDLDAEDLQDPMMVSEYVTEIFEYLKELEVIFFWLD